MIVGLLLAVGLGAGALIANAWSQSAVSHAKAQATEAANRQSNAALDKIVTAMGTQYGSKVGISVYDTQTAHIAAVNAHQQFVSASLYKLFVAYGVLRDIDRGSVSLAYSIPSLDESVNTCLNKMITVSDNDCGKALGGLVGWKTLDTVLASEGYTGTMLNNYDSEGNLYGNKQTTAADVALLLQRLYDGSLLSASSNALFLQLLGSQEVNSYLPSGFPSDTRIAHKTGTLYGYVHDAGIVYGAHKNLIVVFMSGQWVDPDPDSIPVFKAFGQSLESYLVTY